MIYLRLTVIKIHLLLEYFQEISLSLNSCRIGLRKSDCFNNGLILKIFAYTRSDQIKKQIEELQGAAV